MNQYEKDYNAIEKRIKEIRSKKKMSAQDKYRVNLLLACQANLGYANKLEHEADKKPYGRMIQNGI